VAEFDVLTLEMISIRKRYGFESCPDYKYFKPMKYTILFFAAVIIEIASTFYISAVSDRQLVPMIFWAFVGPFLGLPFLAYQIEAKNNWQRAKLALCYGLGYATGAALVNIFL
jgi:hypothetical protein